MSERLSAFDAVFIWGFGKEGRAAFDHMRAHAPQARLTIVDAARPDDLPPDCAYIGEDALPEAAAAASRALIVKSPGVSLYDPRLAAAMAAGARLTSQTNLWLASRPAGQRVIAVTGTKGKSTSAALLHHMLRGAGADAVLAGNIGEPALKARADADTVVLELSSYQIADLVHAPDAFIFLNLMSEHVPWHRSVEAYRRDKARLAMLDPNAPGVMCANDARLKDWFVNRPNTLWFGAGERYDASGGIITRGGEAWGSIPALPGPHNALNACAGLTMVEALGLDARAAFDSLQDFTGLEHRLQTVARKGALSFVDDSLATTPEACLLALDAFPGEDIALILGGEERSQDYAFLAGALERYRDIRAIIAIPENGPRIIEALAGGRHGTNAVLEDDFDRAVARAAAALPDGGVVLLSPAAPRGKAFTVFGARGRAFRAAAERLCAG